MSRASKKMPDLLRNDKAKKSEFEAIPSAELRKNISFGAVSMQNVKWTEQAGSDFNACNVYCGWWRGAGWGFGRRFRLTSVSVQPLPCKFWSFRCGVA